MKLITMTVLFLLCGAAQAQQRHESLRVSVQIVPQEDGIHANVAVRIYNLASVPVNVWIPEGIACWSDAKPGSVTLEWEYKGDFMNSGRAVQGIQTTCFGDGPIGPSREVRAGTHVWKHFEPGQHADIHDSVRIDELLDGRYEVRAVYTAPAFTPEQKQDLRVSEIETPKGRYRSEVFIYTVHE